MCSSTKIDPVIGQGYIGVYAKTVFENPIPPPNRQHTDHRKALLLPYFGKERRNAIIVGKADAFDITIPVTESTDGSAQRDLVAGPTILRKS